MAEVAIDAAWASRRVYCSTQPAPPHIRQFSNGSVEREHFVRVGSLASVGPPVSSALRRSVHHVQNSGFEPSERTYPRAPTLDYPARSFPQERGDGRPHHHREASTARGSARPSGPSVRGAGSAATETKLRQRREARGQSGPRLCEISQAWCDPACKRRSTTQAKISGDPFPSAVPVKNRRGGRCHAAPFVKLRVAGSVRPRSLPCCDPARKCRSNRQRKFLQLPAPRGGRRAKPARVA
jgi:hypothetical protein